MEYTSNDLKSFKTPAASMKSKYLRVDMIRVALLRKIISKNNHNDILNKSITEIRVIING